MPTRPVISQVIPVSSWVSRTAASVIDSPRSMPPPGTAQLALSVRRMSRISPWSLTTITFADGTILLALGAAGSLRWSIRLAMASHFLAVPGLSGLVPYAVETAGVGLEQRAGAEMSQVQDWGEVRRHAVGVGVDQHVVVEPVDRVVQRGGVQLDGDARMAGVGPVVGP